MHLCHIGSCACSDSHHFLQYPAFRLRDLEHSGRGWLGTLLRNLLCRCVSYFRETYTLIQQALRNVSFLYLPLWTQSHIGSMETFNLQGICHCGSIVEPRYSIMLFPIM